MKRVLVMLVAGTALSGAAALYAATTAAPGAGTIPAATSLR